MKLFNNIIIHLAIEKKATLVILFLGGMLLCPAGTALSGDLLDDSLSPQKQYVIQFEWAHEGNKANLSRGEFYLLRSSVAGVEIRLNTAAYVGQKARIYLGLPSRIDGFESTGGFLLSWDADRVFSPGEVRPGNRALIFDGTIDMPLMVEMFTFTLEIDAKYLTGKIRYAPIYEIEIY